MPSLTLPEAPAALHGPLITQLWGLSVLANYEAYLSNEALSAFRAGLDLMLSLPPPTQQHYLWEECRTHMKEGADGARRGQAELRRWG